MVKKFLMNLVNYVKENPAESLIALGSFALVITGKGDRAASINRLELPIIANGKTSGMVINSLLNRARRTSWDSDILKLAQNVYNIAVKDPESKAEAIAALDKMLSMTSWSSTANKITDLITKLA
jgi:hypothetical protein